MKAEMKGQAQQNREPTLYERLGGENATHSLVGALYFHLLNDARVAHFFEGTDVGVLLQHQKDFLKFAFGGEETYSGRVMSEAHRHLVEKRGLNDDHFDAMVGTTAAVLRDLGYSENLIESTINRIERLRDGVLGRDDTDTH